IEDLRIDFEDGYGTRDDGTEDADAIRAARALPDTPYVGLRVKSFDTAALRRRSIRTLDLFLSTVADRIPPGLLITFPKVTDVRQIAVFVTVLERLETNLGLPAGTLVFEIQVETTQAIVDSAGQVTLPGFIAAGQGRVRGLHFGTYDYTAGVGLPSASQHLAHAACDFARHIMQVSAAGTGIWCSDGSTNILPVGDPDAIQHGWHTHATLVRRALDHGFYQGWDLHPNQLVTRYATVYRFYRDGLPEATARLANYLNHRAGSVADEPATARMLAAFLLRARRCGAIDEDELPVGQDRLLGLL
ncbi:MAG TPA: aldolase, partial [Pseudonocardiaceae bacterium]